MYGYERNSDNMEVLLMGKKHIMLNIDSDLLELAKLKYPRKVSFIIEEFLKNLVLDDHEEEKNHQNINEKIEKVKKGVALAKIELNILEQEQKDDIERAKEKEREKLEQKKANLPKCFNCGCPIILIDGIGKCDNCNEITTSKRTKQKEQNKNNDRIK